LQKSVVRTESKRDKEDPPEWIELAIAILGALPTLFTIGTIIYNEVQKVKWPEIKLKWPPW